MLKKFAIMKDLKDDRREILLERVVGQMEEYVARLTPCLVPAMV